MHFARSNLSFDAFRATLCLASALLVAGCSALPKEGLFALDGVDPNSSVAAEVREASRAPGPYPHFNKIAGPPTDLRPATAWKPAVVSEWREKKQVEADAAAIPFTLNNSQAYADTTQARISPQLATQAPSDAEAKAQAFAAAQAARATPPPTH